MKNRDQIFEEVKEILVDMFEVDPADAIAEADLYEDLDIDSIDAVDLIVKLKEITGKKPKPEDFKAVRTVDDVVEVVANLLEI